ncbi:MAG: cyclic nucleotide-binding domain-containing protein [Gammaproteobacteria bacterium]|nr:cyclic nucleotide-binding domain-containing protein [Gammaproteobacteria bacterium]MCP5426248.1 cyclic nucleotide-binding domain-containing protein [Gammaproteobacteria bacterium]
MNEGAKDDYIAQVGVEIVKNSLLGEGLSAEQCELLAPLIQVRGLRSGEFLLYEGQIDNALHVILKGKLEVVKQTGAGETVTLHVLREGELAGELGFIDGLEHSAGLRALNDCEVLSLEREKFESLIHRNPDLVYQVMCTIVRTVHGILRRMNVQYVEMTNYIFKQHGRY